MEKAKTPASIPSPDVAPYGSKRAKSILKYTYRMRRDPNWYERKCTVPPKPVSKEDLISEK